MPGIAIHEATSLTQATLQGMVERAYRRPGSFAKSGPGAAGARTVVEPGGTAVALAGQPHSGEPGREADWPLPLSPRPLGQGTVVPCHPQSQSTGKG